MNTQKQNWFRRHWVISGILGFFILIIAIGVNGPDAKVATNLNTNTATGTQETTKAGKQYVEVAKFSGVGQKKSEPFLITGNRFKISYDCKGNKDLTLCVAFVYEVGSKLPQGVMNTSQATKDETTIYGSGEYYIDANVIGNFSMTIYDYK